MVKKNTVSTEDNEYSLELFNQYLANLEHFIFFGTLLGFNREGRPIPGDDDVDILVNKKHYEEIRQVVENLGFLIDETKHPNNTKFFLQVEGKMADHQVRVDFYFYDSEVNEDFILEYWNIHGQPENKKRILKIPKALIFPLTKKSFKDLELNLPCHSKVVCEFLYGASWTKPRLKKADYANICHEGRLINYKFLKIKNFLDTKEFLGKAIERFIL